MSVKSCWLQNVHYKMSKLQLAWQPFNQQYRNKCGQEICKLQNQLHSFLNTSYINNSSLVNLTN